MKAGPTKLAQDKIGSDYSTHAVASGIWGFADCEDDYGSSNLCVSYDAMHNEDLGIFLYLIKGVSEKISAKPSGKFLFCNRNETYCDVCLTHCNEKRIMTHYYSCTPFLVTQVPNYYWIWMQEYGWCRVQVSVFMNAWTSVMIHIERSMQIELHNHWAYRALFAKCVYLKTYHGAINTQMISSFPTPTENISLLLTVHECKPKNTETSCKFAHTS